MGNVIELPPPLAAQIWTWVEPFEFQELERRAQAKDQEISEYVRSVLREHLAS